MTWCLCWEDCMKWRYEPQKLLSIVVMRCRWVPHMADRGAFWCIYASSILSNIWKANVNHIQQISKYPYWYQLFNNPLTTKSEMPPKFPCSQKRIQQYAVQVTMLHLAHLKYQLSCNFPLTHRCVTPEQHIPYITILFGKENYNFNFYFLFSDVI